MDEEFTFNEEYEKLTTGTRAHANEFNKIFYKLFENDKFLKYAADSLAEKMLEKGMIANNLVTDNTEMVLAAPMGKLLKEQLDEQNKNITSSLQYKFISSPNTILSILQNTQGSQRYFILNPYYPQDSPFGEGGEAYIEILSDEWNMRKKVIAYAYGGNQPVFTRSYFDGNWNGEWQRIITNSDFTSQQVGISAEDFEWNRFEFAFRKSCNIVQITAVINPVNNINVVTRFASIGDPDYRPLTNVFIIFTDRHNNDLPVCCFITSDGIIRTTEANQLIAGHTYYATVSYVVK